MATLFWSEAGEFQARQDLRTALSDIRRATGDDHLLADTEAVSFGHAPVWIDACEPEPHRLSPFLEGFNLKDAPEFDGWVSLERDRWQQHVIKRGHARAEEQEAQGEWTQVIATARQLLELDAVHEETHRQLMGLFFASSDRAAALEQYETARAVRGRELAVGPIGIPDIWLSELNRPVPEQRQARPQLPPGT